MGSKKVAKKAVKKAARRVVIPHNYLEDVERGVKLLDMLVGRSKWLKKINVERLHIRNSATCVAGSVFDNYRFEDGYKTFLDLLNTLGGHNTSHFGFCSDGSRGWQVLQDLWVAKIKRLKAAQRTNRK